MLVQQPADGVRAAGRLHADRAGLRQLEAVVVPLFRFEFALRGRGHVYVYGVVERAAATGRIRSDRQFIVASCLFADPAHRDVVRPGFDIVRDQQLRPGAIVFAKRSAVFGDQRSVRVDPAGRLQPQRRRLDQFHPEIVHVPIPLDIAALDQRNIYNRRGLGRIAVVVVFVGRREFDFEHVLAGRLDIESPDLDVVGSGFEVAPDVEVRSRPAVVVVRQKDAVVVEQRASRIRVA